MRIHIILSACWLGAWALPASAGSCPQPDDEIDTDRPDVTNSSVVVPNDSWQIENGINVAKVAGATVVDGTNTRIRFGIGTCEELLVDLPNYSHATTSSGSSGATDIAPAVKVQLFRNPETFTASVALGAALPTGSRSVAGRGLQPYVQVPWSKPIDDTLSVNGMSTLFWLPAQPSEQLTGEQTLSLERAVGSRADLFLEYAGDYSGMGTRQIVNVGGAVRLTSTQQLDFHGGAGLDRRAPRSFIGVGYSARWDANR